MTTVTRGQSILGLSDLGWGGGGGGGGHWMGVTETYNTAWKYRESVPRMVHGA